MLQLQQNRACTPLHYPATAEKGVRAAALTCYSRNGRARRCTTLLQQKRACAPPLHFDPGTQTLQTVWERGSDPHNGRYYGSIGAPRRTPLQLSRRARPQRHCRRILRGCDPSHVGGHGAHARNFQIYCNTYKYNKRQSLRCMSHHWYHPCLNILHWKI